MIKIVEDGNVCVSIISEQEATALFAAEELQKYIFKLTGCRLPINNNTIENISTIFIGNTQWLKDNAIFNLDCNVLKYDGFIIKSFDKGLILTSNMGRGVLYSVYALLELLGCRWFFAGENGEFIPTGKDIHIEEIDRVENPDFEIRSFTEDARKEPSDKWKDEMTETIEWCGKNRINSFHIHTSPFTELEGVQYIIHEIKKRGMRFEYGGHGTQFLVDRKLFDQKPYLFTEKDGHRSIKGNICSVNTEAIEMLTEGVKDLISKNPQVDLYHLWFEDVEGGSWCECHLCKDIHPSTQQLNVINRIGDAISKENMNTNIDMLLYHDTMKIGNISCDPVSNVYGFFAARERCYAHSLGDECCELNRQYNQMLTETYHKFGNNTYVFDYYADMILFSKLKISIPKVITEDLKHYKKIGINKAAALFFGKYSWWAYPLNMYVFAKAAWNTNYDYIEGMKELCELVYNRSSEMMLYFSLLEKASYGMLTFCGYTGYIDAIRNIPPQAHEFHIKHIEQIKTSIALYEQCLELLEKLIVSSEEDEKKFFMNERDILLISVKEAESTYHQMMGRYLYDIGEIVDNKLFNSYMDKAIDFKNEIKDIFRNVPEEVSGACEVNIFLSHLCDDLITFLNNLKENPRRQFIWE